MDRFFIAFLVDTPWPQILPQARLLSPDERHLTIAFLGKNDRALTIQAFEAISKLPLPLGFCGYFDSIVFLPQRTPRVVAYHAQIPDEEEVREFVGRVHQHMNLVMAKEWYPHVTVGRAPFQSQEWEKIFSPLPFIVSSLGLFESLGNLRYQMLSEIPLLPAIERIEHIADIAFFLRGKTLEDLFHHALVALSFDDLRLLPFLSISQKFSSIDEIIIALNRFISELDAVEGCPFKAVSFHGDLSMKNGFYEWEMIVDV